MGARRQGSGNAKQLTHEVLGRLYAPKWSPDNKRIAFSDSANRVEVVDAAGGKVTQVARDPFGLQRDYVWSPKGSYLAYTLNEENTLPSIFVWTAADGKSTRVTDPLFAESNPAFSPDGKFLYFLGAREWTPQISPIEFNFAVNRFTGVYALTLQKNGPSPFPVQNDEAKAASDEAKDEDDKSKKERKKENDTEKKKENAVDAIDFDGLPARITRAPIDFDNIGSISITGKFIVYSVADAFYYGRDGKFKPQMHVYDIAKRKDKTPVENVENAALSDDGQKLLVQADNTFKVYDVDGDGKDSKTVSTSGLAVTRDPRQEFAEISAKCGVVIAIISTRSI